MSGINWESNEEIKLFQDYLRIASVHPNVNYGDCVEFLRRQASSLSLQFSVYHPYDETKPVVVIKWEGSDPLKPSIILNSHMDVVPVFAEQWTHPPFGAEIDGDGKIFARGTQDMKSVAVQYLSAIKRLKESGTQQLKRTIYITFVPDEEIGGEKGMMKFVQTQEFQSMNVGFSLDEGIASSDELFKVFYAERSVWRVHFKCNGTTGHGSLLHKNTSGEKARYLIDKLMDLRQAEVLKLENNPEKTIGDVTSVNLTIMKGGVQTNVVPPQLTVAFDIRLALDVDHDEFEAQLNRWCQEAGGDVDIFYESKKPKVPATAIDDSNTFWKAFRETVVDDLNLRIQTLVFPGRTDSCFLRQVGVPAIGFSPINNTPVLLHDNDEFLAADIYLRGIEIYTKIIMKIGNLD